MKNKKWFKYIILVAAVCAVGFIYSCQARSEGVSEGETFFAEAETESETAARMTASDFSSDESEKADPVSEENEITPSAETVMVCVHVCGQVNAPGVYYLEEGSRVHEAVEAAGGFSSDAADDRVNLAGIISDGEKIYIPSEHEAETAQTDAFEFEEAVDDGLTDLNKATSEELKNLPGIGDSKAEAIISYRESVGPFEHVEDILNVSGVGEKLYDKIKDRIKV